MKPFIFRLQVVLDRALEEEDRLLRQMAEAQQALAEKEQEIQRTSETRSATLQAMTDTQQRSFDVDELTRQRLHLEGLAILLATLQEQHTLLLQRLDAARATLIESMRKRQVLEKLRDEQHAAYRKDIEAQELRHMEEVKLPRLARAIAERAR